MNEQTKQDLVKAENRKDILERLKSEDLTRRFRTLMPNITDEEVKRYRLMIENETRRQPKILECTPGSFFNCLMQVVQMGLSPLQQSQHAYFIPYNNKKDGTTICQLQIGWRGLVYLARLNQDITNIWSTIIYKDDDFTIVQGSSPRLEHTTQLSSRSEKDIIGVYACVSYKNGVTSFEVMNREECEMIRARSQASKYGGSTPWTTDFGEMCRKTVIKRLCKQIPYNATLDEALNHDNEIERVINPNEDDHKVSHIDKLKERLAANVNKATGEIVQNPIELIDIPDYSIEEGITEDVQNHEHSN